MGKKALYRNVPFADTKKGSYWMKVSHIEGAGVSSPWLIIDNQEMVQEYGYNHMTMRPMYMRVMSEEEAKELNDREAVLMGEVYG